MIHDGQEQSVNFKSSTNYPNIMQLTRMYHKYEAQGLSDDEIVRIITRQFFDSTDKEDTPTVLKCEVEQEGTMPRKMHRTDAGYDLYSPEDYTIKLNQKQFIDTRVHILIPDGMYGLVVGRSGLSRTGLLVMPGVIDAGYIGPIGVTLLNTMTAEFFIAKGSRIAQLIVMPLSNTVMVSSDVASSCTERGFGGFGSTGE